MIDALKDSYWDARSEAANALGQEHDGRAVKPLLDVVTDSDATVESSAESALLFLSRGPKAPAPADDLAARLTDPSPKVVLVSAVCLAMLKDARSLPVLMKLVTSPDQTARLDAVKGLGEEGDPSAIPTLRQTLKDPDINMRGWSIIGLGNLKDEASLPDLHRLWMTPPNRTRSRRRRRRRSITSHPSRPLTTGARLSRRTAGFAVGGDDVVDHAAEFLETGRGNNDGIAATVGILGDAEKPAPGILTQVEDKSFPLDGDIFTFQNGIHL